MTDCIWLVSPDGTTCGKPAGHGAHGNYCEDHAAEDGLNVALSELKVRGIQPGSDPRAQFLEIRVAELEKRNDELGALLRDEGQVFALRAQVREALESVAELRRGIAKLQDANEDLLCEILETLSLHVGLDSGCAQRLFLDAIHSLPLEDEYRLGLLNQFMRLHDLGDSANHEDQMARHAMALAIHVFCRDELTEAQCGAVDSYLL